MITVLMLTMVTADMMMNCGVNVMAKALVMLTMVIVVALVFLAKFGED
jgi:hypothetical protein